MGEDSILIKAHLPCPDCGSSDALSEYSDHSHCFSCGKSRKTDGSTVKVNKMPKEFKPVFGEYRALPSRGLHQDTCEKWGYKIGEYMGKPVQIANYYKDGELVGQKLRTKDKKFVWLGGDACLYGQHLFKSGGKMIVVTEGEIDALSVSQAQGNKWPVVSLPHGAQNAPKIFKQELDYLESFESVVLLFDMDDAGREAAQKCSTLLTPGKIKIGQLPLKDANEMLVAGRTAELVNSIWQAKEFIPSGIVNAADIWDDVERPIEMGLSYPFDKLTKLMYGIRSGEIYVLGAGTGLGKTTVFKEIAYHLTTEHKEKVGLLFLEEQNNMTALSMMSIAANRPLHLPGQEISDDEKRSYFDAVFGENRVYLFNHFGSTSFGEIANRIRYLVVSCGVRYIFLDHLAALTTGDVKLDERREIDYIMTKLASMVRELKFTLFLISHLSTTSDNKSHEEGGRVTIKHFRGSRAIGQWADALWALERNQQAEDETDRHTSTFRVLKDRYTGQATGETFKLHFDKTTGRLTELSDDFKPVTESDDFDDITENKTVDGTNDDFTDF